MAIVETRSFPLWAGSKRRKEFAQQILDMCRDLSLECKIEERRGILRGGLRIDVTGAQDQLDAFDERYIAMLDGFIQNEMARRSKG